MISRRIIFPMRGALTMLLALALTLPSVRSARTQADATRHTLRGRIVAIGIPGASAISPVGIFLPGGPIHDNPAFAAYTLPAFFE
jgi:hypothetical protein